jgi:hypothetical protein
MEEEYNQKKRTAAGENRTQSLIKFHDRKRSTKTSTLDNRSLLSRIHDDNHGPPKFSDFENRMQKPNKPRIVMLP